MSTQFTKIETSIKEVEDQESLQHNNKEIEIANKMLENLNQYKTQDAILSSKAKWYEEGEKSMKYFFNLKEINYTKKCLNSILLKDGMITRNQRLIMLEQHTYYKKLFISNPKYLYTHTEPFGPRLTNKEGDSIEDPFMIEETSTVLKTGNDKKSLGTDWLPVDWYKVFFSHFKVYLHKGFWKPLRMVISTHQPEGVLSH